jgi:hypothetical protein
MWNIWMLFYLSWAFFVIIFVITAMVSVSQIDRITLSMRVQDVIILTSSTYSIIVELCTILGQHDAIIGLSQEVTIFTLNTELLTSVWPDWTPIVFGIQISIFCTVLEIWFPRKISLILLSAGTYPFNRISVSWKATQAKTCLIVPSLAPITDWLACSFWIFVVMKGAFETLRSIRVESVAERIAVRSSEIVCSHCGNHEAQNYGQDLFF